MMFFCFLHSVRFWSIFTFILSFWKNEYQIHSYMTSNMDDFKTICIFGNLLVFAYFLKDGRIYLVSLRNKKNPIFSNIFPCAKHVLNTFKLRTLCARFVSFRCIHSICSCYLDKHPSLFELFWYPSPDDGYWNRNVQCRLYIMIINLPIWIIMFFYFLHTVGFWSIFTFIYIYIYSRSRFSCGYILLKITDKVLEFNFFLAFSLTNEMLQLWLKAILK